MFKNYSKYEVFEDGRIWSYSHKKFLKPQTKKDGYQVVNLYDNAGKMKKYFVHRIVYEAVSGEPIPENLEVNHRNETKTDNRFANLDLVTRKQNINWGSANEKRAKANSKQVGAFKDGELVMTFPSTIEVTRQLGFDCSCISKCCRGERKTHKGYEWRYI